MPLGPAPLPGLAVPILYLQLGPRTYSAVTQCHQTSRTLPATGCHRPAPCGLPLAPCGLPLPCTVSRLVFLSLARRTSAAQRAVSYLIPLGPLHDPAVGMDLTSTESSLNPIYEEFRHLSYLRGLVRGPHVEFISFESSQSRKPCSTGEKRCQ
ncbi:hypothetical protein B0T26DRAFT_717284 [Lasiosphaeria miniovina]|uniref:Uncharacterized protein n=1 Tax=Lasiosphaeria miniovina TaxID=1954250 RepID=A0AA40DVL2_9PEZI|nr:uncharacterized protein B0T26DRAFT_717284 [Lasiosphaeria miniovina]KAK0713373.1 hypothetical protein B0T26DRAFT_717284 [Lasiosphaeria miniovina]